MLVPGGSFFLLNLIEKMVAVPQTGSNKPSGKQIKSKNQYKREKAKLRKVTEAKEETPVSLVSIRVNFGLMIVSIFA